jgi:hypothetical protein
MWEMKKILRTVKEQRDILHEICKRKANWIGHILHSNCLLRQATEGKIKVGAEVTGRRGSRRRKLLDNLKERRGYTHLTEEALDRTMWRARFGRGFGPVLRQTTKWMNTRPASLVIIYRPMVELFNSIDSSTCIHTSTLERDLQITEEVYFISETDASIRKSIQRRGLKLHGRTNSWTVSYIRTHRWNLRSQIQILYMLCKALLVLTGHPW